MVFADECCGKISGEEGRDCSARHGTKRLEGLKTDGTAVLRSTGATIKMLALVLPATSRGPSVGTELAYFSCEPGKKSSVYSQCDTKHVGSSSCRMKSDLLARAFSKTEMVFCLTFRLSSIKDKFSDWRSDASFYIALL